MACADAVRCSAGQSEGAGTGRRGPWQSTSTGTTLRLAGCLTPHPQCRASGSLTQRIALLACSCARARLPMLILHVLLHSAGRGASVCLTDAVVSAFQPQWQGLVAAPEAHQADQTAWCCSQNNCHDTHSATTMVDVICFDACWLCRRARWCTAWTGCGTLQWTPSCASPTLRPRSALAPFSSYSI